MRKLLNTIYITTPDTYLTKDGENIVVKKDNLEIFRLPAHNIEGIIYFGYLGASPSLIGFCTEKGIALTFLSPNGHFYGRISGAIKGNVLLRQKQYRISDDVQFSLRVSKMFLRGKLINARSVLRRGMRDYPDRLDIQKIQNSEMHLGEMLLQINSCTTLEQLRGIEGSAANQYFSCFDQLILQQKKNFYFKGRSRRPPTDRINAMLSFLYTLLVHDIRSALETVGLDPYVGFLHRVRPGRPSLALDLMEELRSYIVDRLVLSLVNLKQVNERDFIEEEGGAFLFNEDGRKEILSQWQKKKQDEIMHPYINEKIQIGLIPYVQAMLLSKFIRGELEDYPPFLWK